MDRKVGVDSPLPISLPVLVTGSNGFIGVRVVKTLLDLGFLRVRCFARPSSRLDALTMMIDRASVERRPQVIVGDLLSRDDCMRAAAEVGVVYHLAAGFDKSFAGAFMNSALATRNLIDGFLGGRTARRFVNVSSFAVYSNLAMKRGALLDESAPLEDAPQERYDAYGFGKLKQEELVREYGEKRGLPYVILRPGTVYGPGKRDLSGRIGIDTFGPFIHVGGSNRLPLTYVDNCAEAIVLAGLTPGIDGETFNVVDDETMTSRQFVQAYRRRNRGFRSVRIPYWAAWLFCWWWERYSKWSKGQLPPAFNRRRCAAEWKGNRYTNRKLKDRLQWRPKIGLREGMAAYLSQFDSASR